jgi:predicted transcriptional regulator
MQTNSDDVKTAAHQIVDSLPSDATWDDLMYRVYVRQCVDAGLDDARSGRVIEVEEIHQRFGLKP